MQKRNALRADGCWGGLAVSLLLSVGCVIEAEPEGFDEEVTAMERRDEVSQCGEGAHESTPLLLTWDEAFASDVAATLLVENTLREPVTALIEVAFSGSNFSEVTEVLSVRLEAGERQPVRIEAKALDHVLTSQDTPATAKVRAEVAGVSAWAPLVSLAKNEGQGFRWLSREDAERYTYEKISKRLAETGKELTKHEAGLTGTMQWVNTSQIRRSSPKAAPIGVFGAPPSRQQTVCFFYDTNFSQGGVDFASQRSYPARGAKVWLSVPSIGTVFGMTDRQTGCVSFPAVAAGDDFYMGMYFESHTGASANRNIMTRAFDQPGTVWGRDNFNGSPWDVPRNAFVITSGGSGSTTNLISHAGNWRMANLLAVANEMLAFFEADAGDGQDFSHSLVMEADNCQNNPAIVSCATSSNVWVTNGDNGVRKAELIGHEVGHVVEGLYSPQPLGYDYDIDDSNPACGGFGEYHALFSREWQLGAIKEGLASALGAFALSSSPSWKYYKSIPASGGLYTNQVLDLEDAAEFRYLETECGCASLDCITGFGVEADWIRFFWDWWHLSNHSFETHLNRIGNAAASMSPSNVFQPMRNQVPGVLERAAFDISAALHGIDH